jgi:hypothetical protein
MLLNCHLKAARLPIRRPAGLEPGSDGARRIAQGRRQSCDIPKPRIRIEPCFLNDIAESSDTAERDCHRLPQMQPTPVLVEVERLVGQPWIRGRYKEPIEPAELQENAFIKP